MKKLVMKLNNNYKIVNKKDRNIKIEQILPVELPYYRFKNRNCKPEMIRIPLSTPAQHLINMIRKGRESGCLFEKLPCDQVINRNLKEVAKILDINKKISAKTGRHTFATIFLMKTRVVAPFQVLLCHISYRETSL